jgi:CRP/FNR family cyclic AMP-dependent transcriptional regulator
MATTTGFNVQPGFYPRTPTPPLAGRSNFLLLQGAAGRTICKLRRARPVYHQGDPSDAVFLVEQGRVLMTVVSPHGKEAVVGVVSRGDFFGEECIADQDTRVTSAVTLEPVTLLRVEKQDIRYVLRNSPEISERFMCQLFRRRRHVEECLADQVFRSSELRLARVLVMLAGESTGFPKRSLPRVSQTTLGAMVGTTRSRISFFLNKFRASGMIDYDRGIRVDTEKLASLLLE